MNLALFATMRLRTARKATHRCMRCQAPIAKGETFRGRVRDKDWIHEDCFQRAVRERDMRMVELSAKVVGRD